MRLSPIYKEDDICQEKEHRSRSRFLLKIEKGSHKTLIMLTLGLRLILLVGVAITPTTGDAQPAVPISDSERNELLRSVFRSATTAADRYRQAHPGDVNGAMEEATRTAGRMVQAYYREKGQAVDVSTLRFAVRGARESAVPEGSGDYIEQAHQIGFAAAAKAEATYALARALRAGEAPENYKLIGATAAAKMMLEVQTSPFYPERGPIQAGQVVVETLKDEGFTPDEAVELAKKTARELRMSPYGAGLMVGGAAVAAGFDAVKAADIAKLITEEAGGSPQDIAKVANPAVFPDKNPPSSKVIPDDDRDVLRLLTASRNIMAKVEGARQLNNPTMDRFVSTLLLNELIETEVILKNVQHPTDYGYKQHDWLRTRLSWMSRYSEARREHVQFILNLQKIHMEIGHNFAQLANAVDALEGLNEHLSKVAHGEFGKIVREGKNSHLVKFLAEAANDWHEFADSAFNNLLRTIDKGLSPSPMPDAPPPPYLERLLFVKSRVSDAYGAYQRFFREKAPAIRKKGIRNVAQTVIALLEVWAEYERKKLTDELNKLDRDLVAEAQAILAQYEEFSRIERRLAILRETLPKVTEAKQKLGSLYQKIFQERHRHSPQDYFTFSVGESGTTTWGSVLRYYGPYVYTRGVLLRDFERRLIIEEAAISVRVPLGSTLQASMDEVKSDKITVLEEPSHR